MKMSRPYHFVKKGHIIRVLINLDDIDWETIDWETIDLEEDFIFLALLRNGNTNANVNANVKYKKKHVKGKS